MNDCAKNGEYCKFNKRFLEILSKFESLKWFSNYEIPGEFEFTFDEFGEYQKKPKIAQFLEVEFIKDWFAHKIRKLERKKNIKSSNIVPSDLLDWLTEIAEDIRKEEEGEEEEPLRRKRNINGYFMSRRKKREQLVEGQEEDEGHGGGPELEKPVSYSDILNKIKRFMTVVDKIIKKSKSPSSSGDKGNCWAFDEFLGPFLKKEGIRDGSQYSLAKIKNSEWLNHLIGELEAVADSSSFNHCGADKISDIVEIELQELKKFIEYKEFDDGFSQRMR